MSELLPSLLMTGRKPDTVYLTLNNQTRALALLDNLVRVNTFFEMYYLMGHQLDQSPLLDLLITFFLTKRTRFYKM